MLMELMGIRKYYKYWSRNWKFRSRKVECLVLICFLMFHNAEDLKLVWPLFRLVYAPPCCSFLCYCWKIVITSVISHVLPIYSNGSTEKETNIFLLGLSIQFFCYHL